MAKDYDNIPFTTGEARLIAELTQEKLKKVRATLAQAKHEEEKLMELLDLVDPWMEDK